MLRLGCIAAARRLQTRFVMASVCIPARWCSGNIVSQQPGAASPCTSLGAPCAPSSSSPGQRTLEEQLEGLSEEDRHLIVDALRNPAGQKSSVMGGGGIGPRDADMVAAFTCGKCDFRMVKRFSKHAYTKGIVIVQCPNCLVKHLLADNLGWLEDEAKNVEDFMKEKGEAFVHIGGGDYVVQPPQTPE